MTGVRLGEPTEPAEVNPEGFMDVNASVLPTEAPEGIPVGFTLALA
jgi:hypothetical protein